MTDVGYLIAGWGSVGVTCTLYVAWVLRRGRNLAARVPAERARWMTSKDAERIGES